MEDSSFKIRANLYIILFLVDPGTMASSTVQLNTVNQLSLVHPERDSPFSD